MLPVDICRSIPQKPPQRASAQGRKEASIFYRCRVDQPGILIVDLPVADMDPDATVIKLEFKEPLKLVGQKS